MIDGKQAQDRSPRDSRASQRPSRPRRQAGCLAVPTPMSFATFWPFMAPMMMALAMVRSFSEVQDKSPILEGIRRRQEDARRAL